MKLSIFDLDNTLLKVNTSFRFYLYLYNKGVFPKSSFFHFMKFYIKYKYLDMSPIDLHKDVFDIFLKNKNINSIADQADLFLEKYLDKFYYLPAIEKFQSAIKNNHYTLILSNSPNFLIKPICNILKPNSYNSSSYNIDNDNRIESINTIMDGYEKAKYTQSLMKRLDIKKDDITVYSDSVWDLDLFQIASHKVAVNPCKKLLKIARENKWQII